MTANLNMMDFVNFNQKTSDGSPIDPALTPVFYAEGMIASTRKLEADYIHHTLGTLKQIPANSGTEMVITKMDAITPFNGGDHILNLDDTETGSPLILGATTLKGDVFLVGAYVVINDAIANYQKQDVISETTKALAAAYVETKDLIFRTELHTGATPYIQGGHADLTLLTADDIFNIETVISIALGFQEHKQLRPDSNKAGTAEYLNPAYFIEHDEPIKPGYNGYYRVLVSPTTMNDIMEIQKIESAFGIGIYSNNMSTANTSQPGFTLKFKTVEFVVINNPVLGITTGVTPIEYETALIIANDDAFVRLQTAGMGYQFIVKGFGEDGNALNRKMTVGVKFDIGGLVVQPAAIVAYSFARGSAKALGAAPIYFDGYSAQN